MVGSPPPASRPSPCRTSGSAAASACSRRCASEGARILGLSQHLARLADGAARLDLTLDPTTVRTALADVVSGARAGTDADLVARVTLTGGPLSASANWPPRPRGDATLAVTLHVAPSLPLPAAEAVRVEGRRWPADLKSVSYLASVLATREALTRGAEVGVLHDGDELLEGSEGNLLLVRDGAIVTPPADGRILAGVTRTLVLDVARAAGIEVREEPMHMHDVSEDTALLTTSAVQRIRVLSRLDGRALAAGEPAVTQLRDGLAALARSAEELPIG
jgi:D-alanine transaminase